MRRPDPQLYTFPEQLHPRILHSRVANWSSPRPYNSKVVLEKSCGFGGSEVVLEEKFQKFQKLAANSLFKVDKDYIK